MKTLIFVLLLVGGNVLAEIPRNAEQIRLGNFQARALLSQPPGGSDHAPLVILLPGEGPQGPEMAQPPESTLSRRPAFLFNEMAAALNQGGMITLQLGKPGVGYFRNFDPRLWFYDEALYNRLRWSDLVFHVEQSIQWVKQQPKLQNSPIYLLGYGEGSQLAVDVAARQRDVRGLLFIGYVGNDMATRLDWRLYRREIDFFVKTDVDADRDGWVTREEAARWPEFQWTWEPDVQKISYDQIETKRREDPERQNIFTQAENSPLYSSGVFRRGPMFSKTAALTQDLYFMVGELDVQTPTTETLKGRDACRLRGRTNCGVRLWPYVGHGLSIPRPPRRQPLLDMTSGPMGDPLKVELTNWARGFNPSTNRIR